MRAPFAILASIWLSSAVAHAQAIEGSGVISAWLQQPRLQIDNKMLGTDALAPIYSARAFSPLWTADAALTPTASQLLSMLEQAADHGISPERYHVSLIRRIAAMRPENGVHPLQIQASLDVVMTHALMRYIADMRGGTARPQWDAGASSLTGMQQAELLQQAMYSANPLQALEAIAPRSPQYKGLQEAYKHYRAIAARGGWPEFTPGKVLKPGMSEARIAVAKQILSITDDLTPTAALADTAYDEAMTMAVKRFQARHGIEANGILNAATQKALAQPVEERLAQMQVSLERMRWMPEDLGTRYVLVNVPGYMLTARAGDAQVNMKVIVGKRETKTPLFSKKITHVVLNPSWGVPQKIAVKEMLPKIRKNPEYLSNAGYTVTQNIGGRSEVIDPNSVDWSAVHAGNFHYSFRQNPGDENALGKVKFGIEDSDGIYLHDTANRNLFSRDYRSLSHGCIRLADPKQMAEFVMRQEGWSLDKIDAAYESDASKTVSITPLPVHVVYWTSWVDGGGKVHFGEDIYQMDDRLMVAMRNAPDTQDSIRVALAK